MAFDPYKNRRQRQRHRLAESGDKGLQTLTLLEGILMLVLGAAALVFPWVASLWVTSVVAVVFLVAGLVSGLTTLVRARQLTTWHVFGRLVVATGLALAGLWMVHRLASGPVAAANTVAALTLSIGVVFVVEGTVATVVALNHRHLRGWGWGLLNGALTFGMGVVILSVKAFQLFWVLGVLVGISFLLSGLDLLHFHAWFYPPAQEPKR
ncbi:MAG: HdeD family acid-resistance protein [Cyanobacteriota bacterium]|jgi:uncharacterized membrane protein HdeD (DUF308 family)